MRQPARKKRKAGRRREKAAGTERRDRKRRWLVASCYSMMISCLAMLSHVLTYSINGCWITCPVAISGMLHRSHLSDQRMSVKLTFLLHVKDKNTQSPLLWDATVCVSFLCFSLSLSLPVCLSAVLSVTLSFALYYSLCSPRCVLSRKEPVMGGAWRKI